MPKEKNRVTEKNNDYLYEVLGFALVIFPFIILGNLGRFGSLLALSLKVVLGDYFFIILCILMILGIRCLIKKKFIECHSLMFLGFIILYLGLMLLSHLAIYDELSMTETEVISQTFNLYKNYFKVFDKTYITGGGMIGALFFQVFILLFGRIGVIIIAICFLIVGISFMFNTSLIDLALNGRRLSGFVKKVFFSIIGFFRKIDYSKNKKIKPIIPKININLLSDIEVSSNRLLQEEINKDIEINFKNYIKQNKLFCIYNKYLQSYNSTSYLLDSISDQNFKQLKERVNYFFENQCFIIKKNNEISVEVYNKFRELLTLKKMLTSIATKNLCLGIANNNLAIELDFSIDNQLFICGDYNSGVRNTVRMLIFQIFLNHQLNAKIEILDTKQEFKELFEICSNIDYYLSDSEGLNMLEKLAIEYERRKEVFNFLGVEDYIEANKEITALHPKINLINPIYVFINTSFSKASYDFENKFNYLIKFSHKMAIYFICVIRKKEDLRKLTLNYSAYMMLNTMDIEFSLKTVNSDLGCLLQKKGDFLYLSQQKIRHGQIPYLSMTDYNRLLKKLIF